MLDTILDLNRQVIGATLQANAELPIGSSFGGLHGGYARLEPSAVVLHDLSFVPGVRLSGVFPVKDGQLQTATIRISGSAAAPGCGPDRLEQDGQRHARRPALRREHRQGQARARRVGDGEWPAGRVAFPLPGWRTALSRPAGAARTRLQRGRVTRRIR